MDFDLSGIPRTEECSYDRISSEITDLYASATLPLTRGMSSDDILREEECIRGNLNRRLLEGLVEKGRIGYKVVENPDGSKNILAFIKTIDPKYSHRMIEHIEKTEMRFHGIERQMREREAREQQARELLLPENKPVLKPKTTIWDELAARVDDGL